MSGGRWAGHVPQSKEERQSQRADCKDQAKQDAQNSQRIWDIKRNRRPTPADLQPRRPFDKPSKSARREATAVVAAATKDTGVGHQQPPVRTTGSEAAAAVDDTGMVIDGTTGYQPTETTGTCNNGAVVSPGE